MNKSIFNSNLLMAFMYLFIAGDRCLAYSPQLLWTQTTLTSASYSGIAMTTDTAGNVYVCGDTDGFIFGSNDNNYKSYLAKYSPNGALLWSNVWTTGGGGCAGISVDNSGNIYVADERPSTGYIRKFDSFGNTIWNTLLTQDARDVAIDSLGNSYVTGVFYSAGLSAGITKLDSTGNVLWNKTFDNPANSHSTCNQIVEDAAAQDWRIPGGIIFTPLQPGRYRLHIDLGKGNLTSRVTARDCKTSRCI